MGEAEFEQKALVTAVRGAVAQQAEQAADLRVNTPGGRLQVERPRRRPPVTAAALER